MIETWKNREGKIHQIVGSTRPVMDQLRAAGWKNRISHWDGGVMTDDLQAAIDDANRRGDTGVDIVAKIKAAGGLSNMRR